jgi:hypothetical protein
VVNDEEVINKIGSNPPLPLPGGILLKIISLYRVHFREGNLLKIISLSRVSSRKWIF